MTIRLHFAASLFLACLIIANPPSAFAVYLCNPDNVSDPDIAIDACNKEIAAGRNLAIAYYDRGLAWAKKEEVDKALADYNKAIQIKPDYQNAYISRGNALKLKPGQADNAMADFDRAIKLDPAQAGLAYYNRGNSWRDKNEYGKAIDDYTKAIELMPRYVSGYVNRGNIRKSQELYDQAMEDYDAAIRISPNGADLAYYNRGVTWRKKSQPEKALADYTKYISIAPKDPDGYLARGNIYNDQRDFANAIADYDRALAIDPNYALAIKNKQNAVRRQEGKE